MAKEVLAEADLWLAVEELAEDFVRTRTLGAPELSAFFSVRDGAACSDRVQVLLGFVDTPAARATAKAHGVDRWRGGLSNVLSLSCEPAPRGDGASGTAAAATNDASAARSAAAVTPSGTAAPGGSAAGQPYAGSTA